VHTSVRAEPFGRVILEGMLLGKPVVATAAGGVPELIEDGSTGFLTPPGDAARLAERLIPLLSDAALRQQIGARAQNWARRRFALPRHVEQMSALYESLSKGH
jgi:glycosyltransferase involved in cell wall biosynthesis